METLDEIGVRFGTDKSSSFSKSHNYLNIYEKYFEPLQNKNINLLEIGIKDGKSLWTWREYFKFGNIFGIDINEECKKIEETNNRIYVDIMDQGIFGDWLHYKNKFQNTKFDIIIDDGSHNQIHQQISFNFLFPRMLKSGGIYIIEDIQSAMVKTESTIDFLLNRAKELNYEYFDPKFNPYKISTIHFYKIMAIIIKR